MFCTQCGARVNGDAKFCTGCGTRVLSESPQGAPSLSPSAQQPPTGAVANHRRATTGSQIARGLIAVVILAFMGSKMNDLGMLDDIKSLAIFDTSETIHYRTDSDLAQILRLRISLPEDTYARFNQAFESIVSACAAIGITRQSADSGACLTRNLDGRTVNHIIHLGSRLDDSHLSINEKLSLVN
jgi:hypothetical protein